MMIKLLSIYLLCILHHLFNLNILNHINKLKTIMLLTIRCLIRYSDQNYVVI